MTEYTNTIRLCSNCRNALTCVFPKDLDRPSFYCEEFEIEELPREQAAKKDQTMHISPHFTHGQDSSRLRGLCGDCENHRACGFPKLEGGVWHCEEYQ